MNTYANIDCNRLNLGALGSSQDCFRRPRLGQVCTVILLPEGAAPPEDWTSEAAFEAIISNTAASNVYAKRLVGIGGIGEGTKLIAPLGANYRKLLGYQRTLNFEIRIEEEAVYTMLRNIQLGFRNFAFWYGTLGGRLVGGPEGLAPHRVTVFFPLAPGGGYEKAFLRIVWQETQEAGRVYAPNVIGIPDSTPPIVPPTDGDTLITDDTGTVITDDTGTAIF